MFCPYFEANLHTCFQAVRWCTHTALRTFGSLAPPTAWLCLSTNEAKMKVCIGGEVIIKNYLFFITPLNLKNWGWTPVLLIYDIVWAFRYVRTYPLPFLVSPFSQKGLCWANYFPIMSSRTLLVIPSKADIHYYSYPHLVQDPLVWGKNRRFERVGGGALNKGAPGQGGGGSNWKKAMPNLRC